MEKRSKENPWLLKTPTLTTEYIAYYEVFEEQEVLVCDVGGTVLHYKWRCIEDLNNMLKSRQEWVELGSKDEKQIAKPDTVESWARSSQNPAGGWYGLKRGFRGRFAMYVPPLLEHLGLAELEHKPRNNRIRSK